MKLLFEHLPDWFVGWFKGALIWLVGDLNYQLAYLGLVIIIDTMFAVWGAIKDKEFSWEVMFKKLGGKLAIYTFWIVIFHAADKILTLPNSGRWMAIVALLGAEIISSAKNTAKLGYTHVAEALENLYFSLAPKNNKLQGGSCKDEETNGKDES